MFMNEYEFDLPKGYIDDEGNLHRRGIMRLATAKDELNAMQHPKVKMNEEYAATIILASVITKLGTLESITPEIIENLYISDMHFLQSLYQTINECDEPVIHVTCPHCGQEFSDTLNFTRRD